MSQDTFNKIITIVLFTFFMTLYALSWYTGKPLDWSAVLTFLVPTLNHVVHQYTSARVSQTSMETSARVQIAKDGFANATTNGPQPQGNQPQH